VNPLELQVLVLLSRVPETSAGSVFAQWVSPAERPAQKDAQPGFAASAARRWTYGLSGLSGFSAYSMKNRWIRSFSPASEATVFRPARSSAPFSTPFV
jgi:hypothetical protein